MIEEKEKQKFIYGWKIALAGILFLIAGILFAAVINEMKKGLEPVTLFIISPIIAVFVVVALHILEPEYSKTD